MEKTRKIAAVKVETVIIIPRKNLISQTSLAALHIHLSRSIIGNWHFARANFKNKIRPLSAIDELIADAEVRRFSFLVTKT